MVVTPQDHAHVFRKVDSGTQCKLAGEGVQS